MLGWELLVVLAVFPLPSLITALYYLALHLDQGFVVNRTAYLPHEPLAGFAFEIASRTALFAGAFLVLYLLAQSGEGVAAIGLGGRKLRMDLALLLPVWVCVQLIPQFFGGAVAHALHLHAYQIVTPHFPAALAFDFFKSLNAGVVEEIVVLGYLVHRLEQRGYSSFAIVTIAVVVRLSYHLYYGPGVAVIVPWAVASVLLYRWIRRLAPFIVCHVAWDSLLSLGDHRPVGAVVFFFAFLVFVILSFTQWRKWDANTAVAAA
jgi:hypothetical protein